MNIKLLNERILVQQDARVEKTVGGIFIPETNDKRRPTIGTIKAIGNGKIVSETFKLEERVMFDQFAGQDLEIDGETYKCLIYNEVLLVMNRD